MFYQFRKKNTKVGSFDTRVRVLKINVKVLITTVVVRLKRLKLIALSVNEKIKIINVFNALRFNRPSN